MPINLLFVLVVLAGCVTAVGALLLVEAAAEKQDRKTYREPGRLTPRGLHILAQGTGAPVVILESGLVATSVSWLLAQQEIARFTRVVAYDRAGLGWSSPSTAAFSLADLLTGLHEVVTTASPDAPVVLVGHSFGGMLVRAFAHLHPDQVTGLVLVDPVSLETYAHPDEKQTRRIAFGIQLSRRGAWLARFGLVRGALALVARGSRRLPLWIGKVSAGHGSEVMSRLASEIAKLPAQTYGPIRSHWSRPSSFHLLAQYLRLLPEAARAAQAMPPPLKMPIIILSAATATPAELRERSTWSTRHAQIPNTTHWLQLDRPDLIAEAVRQLIIK